MARRTERAGDWAYLNGQGAVGSVMSRTLPLSAVKAKPAAVVDESSSPRSLSPFPEECLLLLHRSAQTIEAIEETSAILGLDSPCVRSTKAGSDRGH